MLETGGRIDVRPYLRAAGVGGLAAALVFTTAGAVGSGRPESRPGRLFVHDPAVVVVKSRRVLHLFDGESLVRTYPIDMGRVSAGSKWFAGDGRTPVGTFRVVTKNANSPYHRFLGLDYPDFAALEAGLSTGLISPGEAASIQRALSTGDRPDWTTALGGGVGIHGRRKGRDWTGGCIAMEDEHVAELFGVLRIGDRVEVLP